MSAIDNPNLSAPAGVPAPEAVARNLDQAAASLEKFFAPPERPRAPDGKFASPAPEASAPAPAEEPAREAPAEPAPAVEGAEAEEERFEIALDGDERVELTASELAKIVAEQRKPREAPPPPRESEETILERARLAQEREALARERQTYAQRLNEYVPQALRALQTEFPDIRTNEDLYKLAAEDPARYVQFQARREAIASAQAEQSRLQAQYEAEQRTKMDKYVQEQHAALVKAEPIFADPVKGPAEKQALRSYLSNKGFSDDELAGLTDHRTVIVARNAMLYERMMSAKPEAKKVAPMVRAIRPGASRPTNAAPTTAQAAQAARDNLKKTGSVDAFAAMLRAQGVR
jgi:hypothetical protein